MTPHPTLWRRVEPPSGLGQPLGIDGLEVLHTGHRLRWLDSDNLRQANPRVAWALGGPLRRLVRWLGFEGQLGWVPAVRAACARYRPGSFDAILATGNPYVAFWLARTLSDRLECPYALDYRDLWTTDEPHRSKPLPPWVRQLEGRIVRGASGITTVSRVMCESLGRAFGVADRVHVVPNGYDAEELAAVVPLQFREPAIVYAGGLYPPKRVLDPVFAALRPLCRPDLRWNFHYYGTSIAAVRAAAGKARVAERLLVHGEVPRAEALAAAGGAHCAVVVTSVADAISPADRGIVTGKIFELAGMGVPVLLVAPPGSEAEAVICRGGRRFSGAEVAQMAAYLAELLASPRRSYQPPAEFEWSRLGIRLDEILRTVIGR